MSRGNSRPAGLPIVHERAAGIDVGSRFHVVAVPANLCDQPVQSFQAFTGDLQRMADWLTAVGIETVALESTGVGRDRVADMWVASGLHAVVQKDAIKWGPPSLAVGQPSLQ
jgi:hypothetical protein